jgi:hypothetical protein
MRRMRSMAMVAVLLAALPLMMAGSEVRAEGKPGESGFLPLRIGVGAREMAMGGAGVATSSGAAAVYWNAARLPFLDYGTELLLQHQSWLGLFDKETASLAHRTDFGDLGLFFTGFYSDEIERYGEEPVGIPEGTFKPHDVVFGLSFARRVHRDIAAGIAVKLLYERIDTFSDSGYAVDLFLCHEAVIEGLVFGAALTNLGPQMKLDQEPYDLPTAVRLGAAYAPPQSPFGGRLTFAGDLILPNDGNTKAHAGLELRLVPELALRVGSAINYDSQGLTAGVGFRKGVLGVGYAYQEMSNDLDPAHTFALELYY